MTAILIVGCFILFLAMISVGFKIRSESKKKPEKERRKTWSDCGPDEEKKDDQAPE